MKKVLFNLYYTVTQTINWQEGAINLQTNWTERLQSRDLSSKLLQSTLSDAFNLENKEYLWPLHYIFLYQKQIICMRCII